MSIFKKYAHYSALAVVAFFALTSFVRAASFDCQKAGTAIERQICSDGYLNGLDDVLGSNYKKMMASNIGSGAQENLKSTQLQWLRSRNRCQDRQCLVNAYKVRIEEICAYPVISGMHPSCGTPEDYKHLDAGDLISELDGNWYSAQWKYGYVMKNGVGIATSTNSPNFKVGQQIIELAPSSHTSFSGKQVYTDGKFYNVEAQLINGKLHFQGEKNAKWVMERVGGASQATPSSTSSSGEQKNGLEFLYKSEGFWVGDDARAGQSCAAILASESLGAVFKRYSPGQTLIAQRIGGKHPAKNDPSVAQMFNRTINIKTDYALVSTTPQIRVKLTNYAPNGALLEDLYELRPSNNTIVKYGVGACTRCDEAQLRSHRRFSEPEVMQWCAGGI